MLLTLYYDWECMISDDFDCMLRSEKANMKCMISLQFLQKCTLNEENIQMYMSRRMPELKEKQPYLMIRLQCLNMTYAIYIQIILHFERVLKPNNKGNGVCSAYQISFAFYKLRFSDIINHSKPSFIPKT